MVFFGISGDKFKSTQRFKVDMAKISGSEQNKISNIFATFDANYVNHIKEEGLESMLLTRFLNWVLT
jgi:hypothetical protein